MLTVTIAYYIKLSDNKSDLYQQYKTNSEPWWNNMYRMALLINYNDTLNNKNGCARRKTISCIPFPAWLRIRSISTGLNPVLSHTEKSCIILNSREYSIEIQIIRLLLSRETDRLCTHVLKVQVWINTKILMDIEYTWIYWQRKKFVVNLAC